MTVPSSAPARAQARAFWIAAPGRGEIRAEAIAEPGPGEVLVRARFSAVSRGTESLVFSGRVPRSEHERMRAPFQTGDFPGPVKYGYASVGVVEAGPPEWHGRHVFVLFPHQTRYVVPLAAAHPLPPGVPPGRAVLAANLETALNGVWDGQIGVGDRVVVVGAGTVGCLAAWLAGRVPGCDVTLVDINPSRAAVASSLGVAFRTPAEAPRDADVVLHASGSGEGLALALDCAGFESTIVELSWYGEGAVPLGLGGAFHSRRLSIKSSQVGHVADSRRARWNNTRRLRLAMEFLVDRALDALITGESEFDDLPRLMPELLRPGELCRRIRFP
jgi:NADPH:quinone reductase-like Zn-dependent oxidoreductase